LPIVDVPLPYSNLPVGIDANPVPPWGTLKITVIADVSVEIVEDADITLPADIDILVPTDNLSVIYQIIY
jgi:hypothetical protein